MSKETDVTYHISIVLFKERWKGDDLSSRQPVHSRKVHFAVYKPCEELFSHLQVEISKFEKEQKEKKENAEKQKDFFKS